MAPANRRRLLIALTTLIAFPLLLEVGLRAVGYSYPPIDEPIIVWNAHEDRALRRGTSMHRSEPRQLWSPEPGRPIPWGEDEVVNAGGYRGPLLEPRPRPGVLRVATLGDSSTFGHSVAWEETYSARLVGALAERGVAADVLCAGVVGFSVRQGIERYRELVRNLHPDVVIAAFGAVNDHLNAIDLPDDQMIPRPSSHGGLGTELRLALRRDLRSIHLMARAVDLLREDAEERRRRHFQRESRKHDLLKSVGTQGWPGTRRVSPKEFEQFLGQLAEEVAADGAAFVALSMPRRTSVEEERPVLELYSRRVARVAEQHATPLVDGRASFLAAIAGGTPADVLFADPYHPTAAGHEMLARELAAVIAGLQAGGDE